jgi:hypothetical protein
MQNLYNNVHRILDIKDKVKRKDENMYSHYIIHNNHVIDENTITIVMTSSNRSEQTYFTLKTIANSIYKNVQIIIVDDSDKDPISVDRLKEFPFYIDFIVINRKNKEWVNPCVNYNIGFSYIKGSKIIIQNAEVFHIGDIISFVNETVVLNHYYVFDVKSSLNYDTNKILYETPNITTEIYNNQSLFSGWYQHKSVNKKFHYLTALSTETFSKIKEFSYDHTMGIAYDDDDFLLKIINEKINIINIFNEDYFIGGIHLFHTPFNHSGLKLSIPNQNIHEKKIKFYNKIKTYVDMTLDIENFGYKYFVLNL